MRLFPLVISFEAVVFSRQAFIAVLRIRDVLVRIWIRESVPLTKESRTYTIKKAHRKSLSIFPYRAGMSLSKLSLGGDNDVIYKLLPPRESLVSDIPAGDGNIERLFL